MLPIVICGENNQEEIYNLIKNNIKNNYTLLCHRDFDFIEGDIINENKINLYLCSDFPRFKCSSSIIIFSSLFKDEFRHEIPSKATCIIDSSNKSSIKVLSGKNVQVITCGMSSKNTTTISSIDFPRVAVSMQRSIINYKGEIVYPKESIMILDKEYDIFPILACYSILLIYNIV